MLTSSSADEVYILMTSPTTSASFRRVLLRDATRALVDRQASTEPHDDTNPFVTPGPSIVSIDEAHVTLQDHIAKNCAHFDKRFPDAFVDRDACMLMNSGESGHPRFVFSSRIDSYTFLHPALYRRDGVIKSIEFGPLMDKLLNFQSVFPRELYQSEAVLRSFLTNYDDLFDSDAINSEATIRGHFCSLMNRIRPMTDPTRHGQADALEEFTTLEHSVSINRQDEVLSAAAGHVAKKQGEDVKVDPLAGIAGKCDSVLYFGKGGAEGQREGAPVCAVEFKYLGVPFEKYLDNKQDDRWFAKSAALFPQTIQSLIGHDSPLALAVTEHGFKLFLKELIPKDDSDEKWIRLFMWPPGQELFCPSLGEVDDGLRVLAEVARLATALKPKRSKKRPVEAVFAEEATPSNRPTIARNEHTEDRVKNKAARGEEPRGDKTFFAATENGEVMKLRSVDLNVHFSPEEIAKFLFYEQQDLANSEVAGA